MTISPRNSPVNPLEAKIAELKRRNRFSAEWNRTDSQRRSRSRRKEWIVIMREMLVAQEAKLQETLDRMAPTMSATAVQQHRALLDEFTRLRTQNYELAQALDAQKVTNDLLRIELLHTSFASPSVWNLLEWWVPPSEAECFDLAESCYCDIQQQLLSGKDASVDKNNGSAVHNIQESVLGWQVSQNSKDDSLTFRFAKRFSGFNIADNSEQFWQMHSDAPTASKICRGAIEIKIDVLKRVTDDILLIHRRIRHLTTGETLRTICLLFQVVIEHEYVFCARDINPISPVINRDNTDNGVEKWHHCFTWAAFSPVADDPETTVITYAGTWETTSSSAAKLWGTALLQMIFQWENIAVGPLIQLA